MTQGFDAFYNFNTLILYYFSIQKDDLFLVFTPFQMSCNVSFQYLHKHREMRRDKTRQLVLWVLPHI